MIQRVSSHISKLDHEADDIHMLVHVCRLIAARLPDPNLAAELFELADSLDRSVERLRQAGARRHPASGVAGEGYQ